MAEQKNSWTSLSTGARIGIIAAGILIIALLVWLLMSLGGGGGSTPEPTATAAVPAVATADTGESTDGSDGTDDSTSIVIPTAAPGLPMVVANSPTNIRGGPSTDYNVIGFMNQSDSAEVIGINQDNTWYAIKIPTSPQGSGWVFGQLVTATDVAGIPVIAAPPLPAPTTAPPVVITDWKGEYFDNRDLAGDPVLVRNDAAIDFNWGAASPAPEVPAQNWSARWTISRNAPAGLYTISAWVDDGVRVYVDNDLVINGWTEGQARNYTRDVEVDDGAHTITVEYFQGVGGALISLSIGYQGDAVAEPPTAVINGPTQANAGQEVVFDAGGSTVAEGSHITETRWDFGDDTGATGNQVSHVFTSAGIYNVKLTLVDDRGLSGSATQQINVAESAETPTPEPTAEPTATATVVPLPAPVPGIQLTPDKPSAGVPVTFNGSTTVSSVVIDRYEWDFGDGNTAAGQLVEHIYAAEGPFVVTLTAIDANGTEGIATLNVVVEAAQAVPLPATVAPTEEGAGD